MNKLLKLSALFMVLILSACSSDDEPEPEYTGPWQIVYDEAFYGWTTKDPTFKTWFDAHQQDFEAAEFRDASGETRIIYSKDNGDWIEWQDYKTWYQGNIIWYETVEKATESEIKAKVAEFESFTSYKDKDHSNLVDDFKSQYRRLEQ